MLPDTPGAQSGSHARSADTAGQGVRFGARGTSSTMRTSVPGLRDLLGLAGAQAEVVARLPALVGSAAATLVRVNRVLDVLEEPLIAAKPALNAGLVRRLVATADQVPDLLDRVSGVIGQLERVAQTADGALGNLTGVVARADDQVRGLGEIVTRATAVANAAGSTVVAVDGVVDRVDTTVTRVDRVVGAAADSAGRVDEVVADARRAIDDIAEVSGRADATIGEIGDVTGRADTSIGEISRVTAKADTSIGEIERVTGKADYSVGEIDRVTDKADHSIGEIERVTGKADYSIGEIDRVTGKADYSIGEIDRVTDKADHSIGEIERVTHRAESTVTAADELLAWARQLVALLDPPVRGSAGPLTRLSEVLTPDLVEMLPGVLRRLPPLVIRASDDLFPALEVLQDVTPDVRTLKEVVERLEPVVVELQQTLMGVPGAGLLKRRGSSHENAEKPTEESIADSYTPDTAPADSADGKDAVDAVAHRNSADGTAK